MHKIFIFFSLFFVSSITASGQTINWLALEDAQSKASENGKKVLLFTEAEWCGYCEKMNKEVFTKEAVADSLQKYFYPVRIDIESDALVRFNDQDYTEKSLSRKFRALRTPTTIFLDSEGSVIGTQSGYIPPKLFDKLLAYIGSELYQNMTFEEYKPVRKSK